MNESPADARTDDAAVEAIARAMYEARWGPHWTSQMDAIKNVWRDRARAQRAALSESGWSVVQLEQVGLGFLDEGENQPDLVPQDIVLAHMPFATPPGTEGWPVFRVVAGEPAQREEEK